MPSDAPVSAHVTLSSDDMLVECVLEVSRVTRREQDDMGSAFRFKLIFFDLKFVDEPLQVLTHRDQERAGHFAAVCLLPPAATLSRFRERDDGREPPLRSRAGLCGVSGLLPTAVTKFVR